MTLLTTRRDTTRPHEATARAVRASDQVVGKVKETAEKAVDKMKDALTSNKSRGRA